MTRTTSTSPQDFAPIPGPGKATRWAWGICWLMFASTVLNYMDRQSLALVSPQVRREFQIDFEGFGWVLTAFSLAYALFQVPAGFVVDRFNTRMVYAGAVAMWSLAAIATAFSPVLGALIALRALLGIGESFNWPAALKVTGTILPPKDRSLGNGIFNSGAAVGAVLTPLTVPLLTAWFGWRTAFVVIGSLGFAWVAAWLTLTRARSADLLAPRPPAEPAPAGPESGRRTSRRAKLAFLLVVLLTVGTITAGYVWDVPVNIQADKLRPTAPVTLTRWLVEEGAAVKSGTTVLAEMDSAGARMDLLAPADGRVVELLSAAGTEVRPGDRVLTLDDTAGQFGVELRSLRPSAPTESRPSNPVSLAAWRVEPSEPVHRGDVLADVSVGGSTFQLISPHDGVVARFEVASGEPITPGQAPVVLHVRGFDQKANGLHGIWVGIAVLMFGSLVATRLIPLDDLGRSGWARSLGEVARRRRFWLLVVVTCSINVCWHFLVNWLPTYLQTDRKMTYMAGGVFSSLPFLMADAGNLFGGAASRGLATRGMTPWKARAAVMTVCGFLIACGAIVGVIPGGEGGRWDVLVLVLLGLMALGAAAFMANYFAFCQEVSPRHTGLIVGYLGGLGNLLAAGFYPMAGKIKDTTGSFGPVFLVVGLIPFVGLAALLLGWGADRPEEAAESA